MQRAVEGRPFRGIHNSKASGSSPLAATYKYHQYHDLALAYSGQLWPLPQCEAVAGAQAPACPGRRGNFIRAHTARTAYSSLHHEFSTTSQFCKRVSEIVDDYLCRVVESLPDPAVKEFATSQKG